MPPSFPFSAIVGQATLKRALFLSVIQPSLGGVLIRGTKGLAKSTAVRSLTGLLPPIQTVTGCPFQRRPGEDIPGSPLPADAPILVRPVPLVELPLGATEDRVLGSLHLEKALRGERAFEPGLLAAANRGILYIDEVNLLPDHLVDILLDAAAAGVHRLERESLSLSHPANFVLIGTMNPEEGDLRPQLLDRFGLVVDMNDLSDPSERAEAVRRRLGFEADPISFADQWRSAEEAEAQKLVQARELLSHVKISPEILQAISNRCLEAGTDGLRADLTMARAALAWAAYQGRTEVEPADVEAVAELALAHRRTRPLPPSPDGQGRASRAEDRGSRIEDRKTNNEDRGRRVEDRKGSDHASSPSSILDPRSSIFHSAGLFVPRPRPSRQLLERSSYLGRWRPGTARHRGPGVGGLRAYQRGSVLSWGGTLRAAAPFQADRGPRNGRLILRIEDLRGWPWRGPAGCLLLFVVDASGSMGAWQRMRRTKSAVLSLLVRSYQRRDQVAMLVFRGKDAELVLPPTRGLHAARRALETLPVGGTTPLAHALLESYRLVRQQRRQLRQPMWLVLLTDGRANVSLHSGDPWFDALSQGRALAAASAHCLVVDTEIGWPRFGRAIELARAMKAACVPLDDVLGRPLADPWKQAV